MQAIFVGSVISETIEILSHSHSLNQAFHLQQSRYHEYNHILEAIADAMLDQTKRTITEGLVKQNRIAFSRVEDDIAKIQSNLRRHNEGFIIDT
jgi:vacuolar-type H+-ATPase subunit C/Vma6